MSDLALATDAVIPAAPATLRELIRSDLARYLDIRDARGDRYSRTRVVAETLLFKAGWHATLLYRISHWLGDRGLSWLAWATARASLAFTGADIEYGACIGPGLLIVHPAGIVVGRGASVGSHATLFQGVTLGIRDWTRAGIRRYPMAGDRCFFFARATVLGGVTIGSHAVIGAHALVLHDVPAGALAIGVPAAVHRGRGREAASEWVG